jgi:hypothetical protein
MIVLSPVKLGIGNYLGIDFGFSLRLFPMELGLFRQPFLLFIMIKDYRRILTGPGTGSRIMTVPEDL